MSTNTKFDYDVFVIGCGPAGQRAAIQAAKFGKSVALVDKREFVGGNCVNTGTIPSKSFKEAVAYLSGYRQKNVYGADYRVKSDIQMGDLTFRCHHIMQTEIDIINQQLRRNKVELLIGTARFVNEHKLIVNAMSGAEVEYTAEKIVIAVGAHPFHPPTMPIDGKVIFDSDGILEIPTIPDRLTIVGGGVIGTEYGSIFTALGSRVTIIDSRDRLLGFVDREITETLQYHLRSVGTTLRLGEEVASCAPREDGNVVTTLKSGKVIVSDAVLVSAGRRSATEHLALDAAGVTMGDRGLILVNEHFQTSQEHIYAVGDVIGFPALAATSSEQGRKAALHACSVTEDITEVLLPFGIYSLPEISYVGETEQELTKNNIPYEVGIARFRETARGQILGDTAGLLKVLFHRETQAILGVHIIGESATELIHIGQAVIALDGRLHYLRDAVFNYPTLAELYKIAALDGINKLRA